MSAARKMRRAQRRQVSRMMRQVPPRPAQADPLPEMSPQAQQMARDWTRAAFMALADQKIPGRS